MANPGVKVKRWKLDSSFPVQHFPHMYLVHLYSSAFECWFLPTDHEEGWTYRATPLNIH